MNAIAALSPSLAALRTKTSKIRWSLLGLNLLAATSGLMLGTTLILAMLGKPSAPSLSGPISPGEERTVSIAWPPLAAVNGQPPSIAVDLVVSERVAGEIAVVVEMIDPANPAQRYHLGRIDPVSGPATDGLIGLEASFALEPHLRTLRGAVRQIEASEIALVVRTERVSGQRAGHVYLLSAAVVTASGQRYTTAPKTEPKPARRE
jgi:hypothetical protein